MYFCLCVYVPPLSLVHFFSKIQELMGMVSRMGRVSWEEAVEVLTVCNLQVEEAFNELQRCRLQPLYDFIFGDYKAFTKNMTEMDFLKELAMEGSSKKGVEYEVKSVISPSASSPLPLLLTEYDYVLGGLTFCACCRWFLSSLVSPRVVM